MSATSVMNLVPATINTELSWAKHYYHDGLKAAEHGDLHDLIMSRELYEHIVATSTNPKARLIAEARLHKIRNVISIVLKKPA